MSNTPRRLSLLALAAGVLALVAGTAPAAMADGGGPGRAGPDGGQWSPEGLPGGVQGDEGGGALQVVVAPHQAAVGQPVVVLASLASGAPAPTSSTGTTTSPSGTTTSSSGTTTSPSGTTTSSSGTPTASGPTFTVDFGDGAGPVPMTVVASGGGAAYAIGSATYAAAGQYQITVSTTDAAGTPLSDSRSITVGSGEVRLEGPDRFATAVALSQQAFPDPGSAKAVVLATGDAVQDALAAAPFAVEIDAPVLLTDPHGLPPAVAAEIVRVLPKGGTVYVLGGPHAVSAGVDTQVTALGYKVTRISAAASPGTSLEIAAALEAATGSQPTTVVVASLRDWADALPVAAWAAKLQAPVLLTPPGHLDQGVADFISKLTAKPAVIVAGGPGALSDQVASDLAPLASSVDRVSGPDRFSTAVDIAQAGFPQPTSIVLATGTDWPDALAGAAEAARFGGPVLLVDHDRLPAAVAAYLAGLKGQVKNVYAVGGGAALGSPVVTQADSVLGISSGTPNPASSPTSGTTSGSSPGGTGTGGSGTGSTSGSGTGSGG